MSNFNHPHKKSVLKNDTFVAWRPLIYHVKPSNSHWMVTIPSADCTRCTKRAPSWWSQGVNFQPSLIQPFLAREIPFCPTSHVNLTSCLLRCCPPLGFFRMLLGWVCLGVWRARNLDKIAAFEGVFGFLGHEKLPNFPRSTKFRGIPIPWESYEWDIFRRDVHPNVFILETLVLDMRWTIDRTLWNGNVGPR